MILKHVYQMQSELHNLPPKTLQNNEDVIINSYLGKILPNSIILGVL